MKVDLGSYNNRGFNPGAGLLCRVGWYMTNAIVFHSWLVPISGIKCMLLKMFGASIGRGVVIKPRVNIKSPWNLVVGDNVWIGENVWIDNLVKVSLGSNVCISQGAYLLTGNHDYKDPRFGLLTGEIDIHEGVWIGARATVCPGVTMATHSVLAVGSVLSKHTESYGVYRGNPAGFVRKRIGLDTEKV